MFQLLLLKNLRHILSQLLHLLIYHGFYRSERRVSIESDHLGVFCFPPPTLHHVRHIGV